MNSSPLARPWARDTADHACRIVVRWRPVAVARVMTLAEPQAADHAERRCDSTDHSDGGEASRLREVWVHAVIKEREVELPGFDEEDKHRDRCADRQAKADVGDDVQVAFGQQPAQNPGDDRR